MLESRRVVNAFLRFITGMQVDVSAFHVRYALNDIPTATVRIPLGREILTGEVSPGYTLLSQAPYRIPVFLFFNVGSFTPPNLPYISHGNYLLFAGYVSQVTYTTAFGREELVVKLDHWLSDLNFSSTLISGVNPENAKSLKSILRLTLSGAGSSLNFAPMGLIQNIVNPNYAIGNLWAGAIFPFMSFLIGANRINSAMLQFNDTPNRDAARALFSWRFSYLPLSVPIEAALRIIDHIYSFIDVRPEDTLTSLAGVTLWQKLLEFAQKFLFFIVPHPLFYRAEPVVLGLSNFGCTVWGHEILAINFNLKRPQVPIKATWIFTDLRPLAGSALDNPSESTIPIIGGGFITPEFPYGSVSLYGAPDFLANAYEPSAYTRLAVASYKVCRSRNPIARNIALGNYFAALTSGHLSTLDKYAHYLYIAEQLSGRTATMVCPFRMDISPGTTIRIVPYNNEFIPNNIDSCALFATVDAVEYSADAASLTPPRTTYSLVGIRNYYEYMSPAYSVPAHPFYRVYFTGYPHI